MRRTRLRTPDDHEEYKWFLKSVKETKVHNDTVVLDRAFKKNR